MPWVPSSHDYSDTRHHGGGIMMRGGLDFEGDPRAFKFLPKPPTGHAWHRKQRKAQRWGRQYKALRAQFPIDWKQVNEAFDKMVRAYKEADVVWDEWKMELQQRFAAIRTALGDEQYLTWWYELPEGDEMIPVIEKALENIR